MSEISNPLLNMPALYVVATPLGNLADITLRAQAVLKAVDVIAAEDTRHSQRLLDAYGIRSRLVAAHEHNEQAAAEGIIGLLRGGASVALITDAGTPAISDPGARIVARVRAAGLPVVPVPGPCAAVAALSVAGFEAGGFQFVGFLPVKSAARRAALEDLRAQQAALVFYESPHRVLECVDDLVAVLEPERTLVVARELTKRFEQIASLRLEEARGWFAADADRTRGEFVLMVSGAPPREGPDAEAERVLRLLLAEMPLKGAARLASEITGVSRNALYALGLALKGD